MSSLHEHTYLKWKSKAYQILFFKSAEVGLIFWSTVGTGTRATLLLSSIEQSRNRCGLLYCSAMGWLRLPSVWPGTVTHKPHCAIHSLAGWCYLMFPGNKITTGFLICIECHQSWAGDNEPTNGSKVTVRTV